MCILLPSYHKDLKMTIQLHNFPNYNIDELGNVSSSTTTLKPQIDSKTGYAFVNLYTPTGMYRKSVHRLVLAAFTSSIRKEAVQVNHVDGNKQNNVLTNLEWVTASENIRHAYATNLMQAYRGENSHRATLTNNQCKSLITELLAGATNDELAIKYELHPNYISLIRHKRRWVTIWNEFFPGSNTIKSTKIPNRSLVNYKCKLSLDTQLNIIARIKLGESLSSLASEYALDPSMLSRVKSESTWKKAYNVYKTMPNDHRTPHSES